MCHAVPVKIIERAGSDGVGERDGLILDIDLSLVPDAAAGDLVIVHVGIALAKVDQTEAAEILKLREAILGTSI
jgi:hydrogenase expression/formation protein HypC